MAYLFKREEDEREFSYPARAVLAAVARGLSEPEAAGEAGIDVAEVRQWKRDPAFRAALRRAKREGPHEPKCIDLRNYLGGESPPALPPPGTPQAQVEEEGWRVVQ